MHGHLRHCPTVIGQVTLLVESPQTMQQIPGLRQVGRRRRTEKLELFPFRVSPPGQIERQRSEVGKLDFRQWKPWKLGMLLLRPQAIANARPLSPCTSPPLIRNSL